MDGNEIPQELLELRRAGVAALGNQDYAAAENYFLQAEANLAFIPNSSRNEISVEFGNKIQDLLDRVRRLKNASRGRLLIKTNWKRAGTA